MSRPQGKDPATLERLFGRVDLTPLWIAEPTLDVAPEISAAVQARAAQAWYGYEVRPEALVDAFWSWSHTRHDWSAEGLHSHVSPSIGTSIGALIDIVTEPGDGVIIQPPVFTDFKPLIVDGGREVVRNPLPLTNDGYRLDLEGLDELAAEPRNKMLILCNPHNPVGRVWANDELAAVAAICAEHDVFVLADEIHADLALPGFSFTPFATAAAKVDVGWAAAHGPIKTFGLAGVCDTLLIIGDSYVADRFNELSSKLHLTRNNVFALAAFEAAYTSGGAWVDQMLELVAANTELLRRGLPDGIELVEPEGTYLAWLDMRGLELEVGEVAGWFASEAGCAVSPGHWFGREGAGFARLTTAVPAQLIEAVVERLTATLSDPRPTLDAQ